MLTFCFSLDAMEWLFMASWIFYDFWAFLKVKTGVFRRKLPFFQIFGILLLSASASLWGGSHVTEFCEMRESCRGNRGKFMKRNKIENLIKMSKVDFEK